MALPGAFLAVKPARRRISAKRAVAILFAVSSTISAACAKHDAPPPPPAQEPGAEAPARVPPALLDIDALANDVFDDLRGDDWVKASEDLPRIEAKYLSLEAKGQRRGAPAEAYAMLRREIADLRRAIEAKDRVAAMRAAADVGFAASTIETRIRPDLPTLVPTIERNGRAILLAAMTDDQAGLEVAIRRADDAWKSVRPSVEARAGRSLATQTDRTIDQLRVARGNDKVTKLAEDLLEEVDSMANLFD